MNLYSRIDPTHLLHIIVRKADVQQGRTDIVPTDEFLQVAMLKPAAGTTYKPHRHIVRPLPHEGRAQESWIVISGVVSVTLYDIDDTLLHRDVLQSGDISITLDAGHNYEIVGDNAYVVEVKTGPYFGHENDKVFINDKTTAL